MSGAQVTNDNMNIKVKICGITNLKDALAAVQYGANALGFIFYKKSPRYISPVKAKNIIKQLPPFVSTIGVFVNSSKKEIEIICRTAGISVIQLHGDEPVSFGKHFNEYKVIRAFRVKDDFNLKSVSSFVCDAYLFDAYQATSYGGSGKTFSWEIIKNKKFSKSVVLSGGLTPYNVVKAIQTVKPYAVDVSSGVEQSPGVKDYPLLKRFMTLVKNEK